LAIRIANLYLFLLISYLIKIETTFWTFQKHLRQSITPTTRSGSKVRRSILQNIPENKEIDVSTPKTPKKTPKVNNK